VSIENLIFNDERFTPYALRYFSSAASGIMGTARKYDE
jgi:hypothetical protein